jgi:hypothetical protein
LLMLPSNGLGFSCRAQGGPAQMDVPLNRNARALAVERTSYGPGSCKPWLASI